MNDEKKIKKNILEKINQITETKDFVQSTTIVGSFESKGLDVISDIDIVIVVDQLNKEKFEKLINEFKCINTSLIGLKGYELIVNSSFGPLKFNAEKTIVFHVMIYDITGHIKHVEASPFTCHSWEQNSTLNGKSLSEIYPVVTLNISDLMKSRRGLVSYLNDLNSGVISYRDYVFAENTYSEKKKSYPLDKKHLLEYSYHIIYHLLNNFYKILSKDSKSLKVEKLKNVISEIGLGDKIELNILIKLSKWKNNKGKVDFDVIKGVKLFLKNFFDILEKEIHSCPTVFFLRHQKTHLNDGTFLGISRDPGIIDFEYSGQETFDVGYHSELLRSFETIQKFLNEIDYGKIEGFSFDELKLEYPDIIKLWNNKKDPKFPDGESQNDVATRVEFFMDEILDINKKTIVVTHLVTLRLILFKLLKIPIHDIYKIQIDHLEGFKFVNCMNFLVPQFNSHFVTHLRKKLSNTYG
jgi:predicted nucleotidyltransferase